MYAVSVAIRPSFGECRMKAALGRLLNSFGLLLPVLRGIEFMQTLGVEKVADAPDGLPLPPASLRIRVVGTTDVAWFLERGCILERAIREALLRAGAPLDSGQAILDFGCGCGCVLRRWRGLDARVSGTDLSRPAIKWCQAHLPFVGVDVNGFEPPLNYGDASFDLIYAISVFTHLPIEKQFVWRDELRRVLRPSGHLLLTLHGDAHFGRLKPEERGVYEAGGCVVRWPKAAGSNLCSTYHSPRFVRDRLADGWEFVEHVPGGAGGHPPQDLVLLHKPHTLKAAALGA